MMACSCVFVASAEGEWNPQLASWSRPALSYKTQKNNNGYAISSDYLNTVLKVTATSSGWSHITATTAGSYSFSVNTNLLPEKISNLTLQVYRYIDNDEKPRNTDTLTFHKGEGVVTRTIQDVMAGQELFWTQNSSGYDYLLMINTADFAGSKGEEAETAVAARTGSVAPSDFLTGSMILTETPTAGDTFFMGWYEQDNDLTNGRERIEWTVLEVNEAKGTVLVISSLALDCRIYHPSRTVVSWGDTYLRNWLVNTFANSALNPREQACIIPQRVANVTDTVTMLDETQIARYKLAKTGCLVSEYAAHLPNPVNINEDGFGCWWVRMDKTTSNYKMKFVGRGGYVYAASKDDKNGYLKKKGGNYTTSKDNGIRPAMLLDLTALRNTALEDDFSVVIGTVVNASNPTERVEGAAVTLGGQTVYTDHNGEFVVGVDVGTVPYTVEHSDYITVSDTLNATGGQQSVTIATSRRMAWNEYRVVLTWGEYPRDLDSHLWGISESGSTYHVFYSHLRDDGNKALLEWDDTTSYGPETTHFLAYPGKTYTFSIHDYSNRGSASTNAMANSGAKVVVYRGDALLAIYEAPDGAGTVWHVFTVHDNEITPVDTMSYCSDPSRVGR
ncbi:MAG: YfaP family protein [Aristaeellaceae bacterium]